MKQPEMSSTTIDLITENQATNEFVLILVEDGPWPDTDSEWTKCLSRIQTRIYDAADVAIDGHLAEKYPRAKGKAVRVQVDSPNGAPRRLIQLISSLQNLFGKPDNNYHLGIKSSPYITGLNIVLGHEVNPFN